MLEAPDSDKISGHIVGAESFDGEIDPPDSQKTESHETAGGAWEAVDPAIKRYGNESKRQIIFTQSIKAKDKGFT